MNNMNIICDWLSWQQKPEASGAHVQLIQRGDSFVKGKP